MIREFYQNKAVLLTGTTGFVGKVVLERMMHECPEIRKFYLLVRPKKGTEPMDRVQKEILSSPCFDNLRSTPQFKEIVQSKIYPIEGDIIQDKLGIKPEDRELLINDLDLIINIAASVNFTERLSDALQINYFGPLRIMELANDCKKLLGMTHVSTAYVNSNIKGGFVKEEIYDWKEDHEELINRITKMSLEEQDENTQNILGDYPNTYTFTKSMAERILKKKRPDNLPLLIVRPSIIGSAYRDPFEGWIDTLVAGGAAMIAVGLGLLNQFPIDKETVMDFIPVDYVANHIIVGTALQANKPGMTVVHASSSHVNPFAASMLIQYGGTQLSYQPIDAQVRRPAVRQYSKKEMNQIAFYLEKEIPIKIFDRISRIPGISSENMKKKSKMQMLVLSKLKEMHELFGHFTHYEWRFENKKTFDFINQITEEDNKRFHLDPREINWQKQVQNYSFGIQKYMFKQDPIKMNGERTPLLIKNPIWNFEDLKVAFLSKKYENTINHKDLKQEIKQSPIIEQAIKAEVKRMSDGNTHKDQERYNELKSKTLTYLNEIDSIATPIQARSSFYFFLKSWRKTFDQLIINENQFKRIQSLINLKKDNFILVPTHRSMMDFVVIAFIHFYFQLPNPFVLNDEIISNLTITNYLMKTTNGIKINDSKMNDRLYKAIVETYAYLLLQHGQIIELFPEKQRSRTGKLSLPNENLLENIIKMYFENKMKGITVGSNKDIKFIPITINYDTILEEDMISQDFQGKKPKQESISQLLKKLMVNTKNHGRINVKYCDPISLQYYADKYLPKTNDFNDIQIAHLSQSFGKELTLNLQENSIIMSTSLLAAILLMYRKGITSSLLLERFEWLHREIQKRNGELNLLHSPNGNLVNKSMGYLGDLIDKNNGIYETNIKNDGQNILLLQYYRNHLIHMFVQEAFVSISLLGMSNHSTTQTSYSVDTLFTTVVILKDLFNEEFVFRDQMANRESFNDFIQELHSQNYLKLVSSNEQIEIDSQNDDEQLYLYFLNSLILPYIECYWITLSYFMLPQARQQVHEERALTQRIKWLIKTCYSLGLVKYFESSMIQQIQNAVKTFENMGILKSEKIINQKRQTQTFYKVQQKWQDENTFKTIYDQIAYYLPQGHEINFSRMKSEIKKLTISEIPIISKL